MRHNDRPVYQIDPSFANPTWSSEQKLARAVILNGIRDAVRAVHPAHNADALSWFQSDSTEPCSFLWWLGFLTDSVDGVAEHIRKRLPTHPLALRNVAIETDGFYKLTRSESHRAKLSESSRAYWDKRRAREAELAALLNNDRERQKP